MAKPREDRLPTFDRVDKIYDFVDPNFMKRLVFRPYKPAPGIREQCRGIPRFLRFKTLSEAEMKEKKRVRVPDSELQLQGVASSTLPSEIPIYKGSILEKRQWPLTGREKFDVYEVYTLWQQTDPKAEPKEICIRWDSFNGRVQLYALVYMVHPNKKAESGRFLDANDLVKISMVPHKDKPEKVATGGNWAGQGYWVPYVVALHYARQWSWNYRYLFVVIWGNEFPSTCKPEGHPKHGDNKLDPHVVRAAKLENDYFREKAITHQKCQALFSSDGISLTAHASTQIQPSLPQSSHESHRKFERHINNAMSVTNDGGRYNSSFNREPGENLYYDPARDSDIKRTSPMMQYKNTSNLSKAAQQVHRSGYLGSPTDIPTSSRTALSNKTRTPIDELQKIAHEVSEGGKRKRAPVDTMGTVRAERDFKKRAAVKKPGRGIELLLSTGCSSDRNALEIQEKEAAAALLELGRLRWRSVVWP